MRRPRVLLADGHALLLGAFEKLLTPECEIVGQVSDGRALVAAASKLRPDVVILDIGMPLLNGLGRGVRSSRRCATVSWCSDHERGSGPGGRSVPRRSVCVSLEAFGRLRADGGDSRSDARPLVHHPARHRRSRWALLNVDQRSASHTLTPRQREVLQLLAEVAR